MPDFNEGQEDHTSIRDLLVELTTEVRGIRTDLHKQGEAIEKFWNWKTGGDEPEKGVDIRMDRLERASDTSSRVAWGAAGGLGLTIIAWVWETLTRKHT